MMPLVGRLFSTSSPPRLFQRVAPVAIRASTSSIVLHKSVSCALGSSTLTRTIFATSSAWKGRKGGSSVLRPKPARPSAGARKKKSKMHGAPFSRIAKDKKIEAKGKRDLEALKTLKLPEGIVYEF